MLPASPPAKAQQSASPEPVEELQLGKREYVQVEPRLRMQLIKKTFEQQMSVRSAAKSLGIKYTTARHIVNVYKRTGHVESLTAMKRKQRHPELHQRAQELVGPFGIYNRTLWHAGTYNPHGVSTESVYCTCDAMNPPPIPQPTTFAVVDWSGFPVV